MGAPQSGQVSPVAALATIERRYGQGSIMRLSNSSHTAAVESIKKIIVLYLYAPLIICRKIMPPVR